MNKKILTALLIALVLILGSSAVGTASTDWSYREVWDGRGKDSENCSLVGEGPRTDTGWIHWVFNTKGASTSAKLILGGTGSGTYDPGPPLVANAWHFYTPYYDLEGLTATIYLYGGLPGPGGGLVISDFCEGVVPEEPEKPPAHPLTISKSASGSYDKTYNWEITKAVDKTVVKQFGGTATFNYTVTVAHDEGTISNVKVSGTITVTNPNDAPVMIDGISDTLDGCSCTITEPIPESLPAGVSTFTYTCTLDAVPTEPVCNTATVTWPYQVLSDGSILAAGSASFTTDAVVFVGNEIDECVDVVDSWYGELGTVCVGYDPNPTEFKYSRTVPVPQWNCEYYENTAKFITNDTGTTGWAEQTVRVCGPMKTGALTMGFWQNKNGQAMINNANCADLRTFLRQYAPFQDLSATASCSQTASYVFNVIKAANASGASMNAMLKGQMLATALNVYFFDIGDCEVDLTMIRTNSTSFQDCSPAFGGAPSLTISQMLTYAASKSNVGGSMWYGNVKSTQELAKNAFDAINNQWAFAP